MEKADSAINRLIAQAQLKKYQEGGQVLQIPQRKELNIIWPEGSNNSRNMGKDTYRNVRYNPIAQLHWKTLLDEIIEARRSRKVEAPTSQFSKSPRLPRSYLDSGRPAEIHSMFKPPLMLEPGPSPEEIEAIREEVIEKFKNYQLGRGVV